LEEAHGIDTGQAKGVPGFGVVLILRHVGKFDGNTFMDEMKQAHDGAHAKVRVKRGKENFRR
jgi:hypothetical protein